MQKNKYKAKQNSIFKVTKESELLNYLLIILDGISKNKAKLLLSNQSIKVNDFYTTKYNYKLKPGDTVEINRNKKKKEFVNTFIKIVYEDEWFIVVEKKAGILTVTANKKAKNVKDIVTKYFTDRKMNCTAHVVHRLDRDTSGLLIFAKDIETQQLFIKNWHEIVVEKTYLAIVEGKITRKQFKIESWLRDTPDFITVSSQKPNDGKLSTTCCDLIDANDKYSMLDVHLITGRKNQIRVHMQDIEHPIVGDMKYGHNEDIRTRLALHAYRLVILHPITHKEMTLEAPLPNELLKLMKG